MLLPDDSHSVQGSVASVSEFRDVTPTSQLLWAVEEVNARGRTEFWAYYYLKTQNLTTKYN